MNAHAATPFFALLTGGGGGGGVEGGGGAGLRGGWVARTGLGDGRARARVTGAGSATGAACTWWVAAAGCAPCRWTTATPPATTQLAATEVATSLACSEPPALASRRA